MFRLSASARPHALCFPRVRGDVPFEETLDRFDGLFSPRARGCSDQASQDELKVQVFPACAGMFLALTAPGPSPHCFPRVRGDVPARGRASDAADKFSPRARGCSA